MAKKKFYAYKIDDREGIASNWDECAEIVGGESGAKYKGFETYEEAAAWLAAGADYSVKHIAPEAGIYFDAGTGSGRGVEISVTDQRGNSLLWKVLPESGLDNKGHHWIKNNVTNNFGELLAAKFALQIALENGINKVFGDSALVINFWSKGHVKKNISHETIALADEVLGLRKKFEHHGGKISLISGGANPADLGFHRN
jgi:ribonuclease HI